MHHFNSFAILKYPNGSREVVWRTDATVSYLQGKHILLFLIVLLIFLASVAYTTLLFSWQWLLRYQNNKILRKLVGCHRLYMFLEPYHAPYIFHHRYWTGLLLFIRAILYIVSAANVSNDPGVNLLAIAIAVVGLLIISGYAKNKVYRRWPLNLLEISCYVNLLCFCLAKLFTLTENSDGITIAYISGSFTVVSFTTVLVYHVYTELFSQTIKRLWKILKQGN